MTKEKSETFFEEIVSKFTILNNGVTAGKMMSSPGLKCNDKVIAFYHKNQMGFRLGANFDPVKFGLLSAKPLNPFKTNPP